MISRHPQDRNTDPKDWALWAANDLWRIFGFPLYDSKVLECLEGHFRKAMTAAVAHDLRDTAMFLERDGYPKAAIELRGRALNWELVKWLVTPERFRDDPWPWGDKGIKE